METITLKSTIARSATDSRIGMNITQLDTPTLLLDRAASDRNLAQMANFFQHQNPKLRPHFKNHKCTTLAKRQLAAGSAVGITCAKLGEAEVLVEHGVTDILIANQIVGEPKVNRLARLAAESRLAVAVDHRDQALAISEAAVRAGSLVHLLVEIDIGMGRCGVQPGTPALELVKSICDLPGVRFGGLQAYEGHLVNLLDRADRTRQATTAMQQAVDTRRMLEQAGIPVDCISGCSSATYNSTGVMSGIDEIQAGTYATMDRQYQRLVPEFEIALSILVRVISRPGPNKAVLDIGVKGAGSEFGVPAIRDYPDVEIPFFLAEEHVVVQNVPDWRIGDVLHLIPSHACTTCNLHREFVVHDAGTVVDVWPIEASGHLR
ncbi:MAG: DSD1 family PLP-dependent enzyme [Planctomycetota bacterium]|nr:DSD1 family PLP-dependent enzyme [Planctomycetota bacterium]MDA1177930.1 DSD1 family PLP-dependent enzyme [Planctomycetota bacterium]